MKIRELIERLQQEDPESEAWVTSVGHDCLSDISMVEAAADGTVSVCDSPSVLTVIRTVVRGNSGANHPR